jgi:hypothetical protein
MFTIPIRPVPSGCDTLTVTVGDIPEIDNGPVSITDGNTAGAGVTRRTRLP